MGLALAFLEPLAISAADRQAGNCDRLAPTRIPIVLEMEESPSGGPTFLITRGYRSDSQNEFGQSTMGCTSHPWGTVEARIRVIASSVTKYMVRLRKPPSQTWRTFLQNHAKDLVASDFFVVPTVFFDLLFVFVILSHDRRRVIHFGVTASPRPSGRLGNCWKLSRGTARRGISCGIEMGITEQCFVRRRAG